jgi:L-ascorbate metabolism protein UlaG (beta-lactamase superfamily)
MDINWLGHSCFRIKGKQATIITDPFPPDLGYTLGKPAADIVTVSHQHPSHAYVQGVAGEPRQIAGPGEYEISGVLIIGIPTFHDAARGQTRGKNTAYLLEVDGVMVCHLGDLGHVLTAEQVEEIDDVDVLLLPVGGVSTVNASTAPRS